MSVIGTKNFIPLTGASLVSKVYLSSPKTPLGRYARKANMYLVLGSSTFGLTAISSASIGLDVISVS